MYSSQNWQKIVKLTQKIKKRGFPQVARKKMDTVPETPTAKKTSDPPQHVSRQRPVTDIPLDDMLAEEGGIEQLMQSMGLNDPQKRDE